MKIEKVLNKLVPDEKEERLRREAITKLETELMFIDENNFNYNKMDTEAIIVEANRLESIRLEKYKKDREFEIEQAELLLKKEKELYFSIHLEVLENSDFDVKLAKPKKDLITADDYRKEKERLEFINFRLKEKINIKTYHLQIDENIDKLKKICKQLNVNPNFKFYKGNDILLLTAHLDYLRNEIVSYEIKLREKRRQDEIRRNKNILYDEFGAVEGGETTFYYLKLKNKFGEIRYKVGVSLNSVNKRYSKFTNGYDYEILFEKKLTHSNTIEKAILKKYQHLVTDESLLGTNGTEIFKEDVLNLDN